MRFYFSYYSASNWLYSILDSYAYNRKLRGIFNRRCQHRKFLCFPRWLLHQYLERNYVSASILQFVVSLTTYTLDLLIDVNPRGMNPSSGSYMDTLHISALEMTNFTTYYQGKLFNTLFMLSPTIKYHNENQHQSRYIAPHHPKGILIGSQGVASDQSSMVMG